MTVLVPTYSTAGSEQPSHTEYSTNKKLEMLEVKALSINVLI